MNCFNHTDVVSVATCQNCQKGLCKECSSLYSIPICRECNTKRKKVEKREIYMDFLLSLVVGFIFYSCFSHKITGGVTEKIFFFYISLTVVSGWKFLTSITPSMFLTFKWIIIYYFMKILLSPFIGLFVFPIRFFRQIRRLFELNKVQ